MELSVITSKQFKFIIPFLIIVLSFYDHKKSYLSAFMQEYNNKTMIIYTKVGMSGILYYPKQYQQEIINTLLTLYHTTKFWMCPNPKSFQETN